MGGAGRYRVALIALYMICLPNMKIDHDNTPNKRDC